MLAGQAGVDYGAAANGLFSHGRRVFPRVAMVSAHSQRDCDRLLAADVSERRFKRSSWLQ